jgi:hypothetical protein
MGICGAQDSSGKNYVQCTTTDVDLLATIRSLSGDSELWFQWDANSRCVFIEIHDASDTAPKR